MSTATGFTVVRNDVVYLVTNWHVVAGRSPVTGQPLHPSGAVPEELVVLHMLPPRGDRLQWEARFESLFEGRVPRWREHARFGNRADVVALPLREARGVELFPYDPWREAQLLTAVSDFVSIIGYPFGRTAGAAFAIWTKGAIASEPDVDFDDLPCFLIDARTRQGQSGSPVIAYSSGGATRMRNGSLAVVSGPVTDLLGIYSGRISEESDLGVVWKSSVIREIIDEGVQGSTRPPPPSARTDA
ncbi:MAG: serine protease [Actinomycetota bacterium]|nr:serine protease [Actinomycetota bacterium]